MQKKKKDADGDPTFEKTLGVGCVLYRETVYKLICLFGVLSIITWPLMSAYASSEPQGIPSDVDTEFARKSLANLGYTSVQCALSPILFEQMSLSCPYGEITNIVENGLGVNLAYDGTTDACLV